MPPDHSDLDLIWRAAAEHNLAIADTTARGPVGLLIATSPMRGTSHVGRRGVELSSFRQNTSPRHKVNLEPDAVWVLEQHVVVARGPSAFLRSSNDRRIHLPEQSSASIHVLSRTGT